MVDFKSFRLISGLCLATGLVGGSLAVADSRTMDGGGNHPNGWGAADTPLLRKAMVAYPDGFGDQILGASDRPNPREISNALVDQGSISRVNNRYLTDYVWQWGQFLDHDIGLTGADSTNGTADIVVPAGDPLGPDPIPFNRSNYESGTGTEPGIPRQQINQITAFIDGSVVYGSDEDRAAWLRTGSGGRLDTSAGHLLPLNDGSQFNGGGNGTNLFVAGDIRANEQVGLTAMHTLFVREHNRLADQVAASGLATTDEEIYQWTRKIVGAEIQVITYKEFLPALMGSNAPAADAYAYDETNPVDPTISNEFSTALYRFGHSMLSPSLQLVDNDNINLGDLPLRDAFFNPDFLKDTPSNLELILKGLASQQAQEIDVKLVDDVRNFLFGPPGAGGLDLASLNIQRGRDHGLSDYNTVRAAYGLEKVTDFSQITSDVQLQRLLESVYGSVDRIDPWIGGLAEDHLPDSSLGALVSEALREQFTRLRDGDRFFYTGDPDLRAAGVWSIIDLDSVTLSRVIQWNTRIDNLQENVFQVAGTSPGPPVVVPVPTAVWMGLVTLIGIGQCRRWSKKSHHGR